MIESERPVFDFVLIGFGFKYVFKASCGAEAREIAKSVAEENRVRGWLLYNARAELIGSYDTA